MASGVAHQDSLDFLTVTQTQEKFPGEPVVAADLLDQFGCVEEIRFPLPH
jgi:hypothetical protein